MAEKKRSLPGMGLTSREVEHNARIYVYPDGGGQIMICSSPIFREAGCEPIRRASRRDPDAEAEYIEAEEAGKFLNDGLIPERDVENTMRAARRARAMVSRYARATPFEYFVTLTLDAAVVDRYDEAASVKRCVRWLDNQVQRHGLAYVVIPEHHKDGAIHFHGFFNSALPVVYSGTMTNGGRPRKPRSQRERAAMAAAGWHDVYNLPAWHNGFSTAIRLYGERSAAVGYVTKYVGKERDADGMPCKIGGRWYYSGGDLRLPSRVLLDMDEAEAREAYPGGCSFDLPTGVRCYLADIPPVHGSCTGVSAKNTNRVPKGGEANGDSETEGGGR